MTEAEARAYNRAIDDMADLVKDAIAAVEPESMTEHGHIAAKALTAFVEAAECLRRKPVYLLSEDALLDPTLDAP